MFGMSKGDVRAMTEDLEKLHEDETKQYLKDQKLLEKIKDQTSFEEFDLIKGEVDLSENSSNFRIVNEPTGDLKSKIELKFGLTSTQSESLEIHSQELFV